VIARLLNCRLMLVSCIAVLGCGPLPGRPKPGPEVPRPDSVVDFATLYRENCSACHGAEGMNGPSYPLANPTYQALVDEQLLHQVVANGAPGTLMPAFAISAGGSLTDEQVDALVHGMRAAWYKPGTLAGANPPPYRAVKTADSVHGQQVYSAYCASCHGAAGQASKSKAGSITEPAFLALISDQVLRTVVIAGRPDIGQPDWRNDLPGHPMSDQDVTDVVGWLSSSRPGTSAATPKKGGGGSQ
jgi:cytochrome c oxidase cbb3-type subunit 3/ubiquinol-cytochrome c reductase cytochrome c subunit